MQGLVVVNKRVNVKLYIFLYKFVDDMFLFLFVQVGKVGNGELGVVRVMSLEEVDEVKWKEKFK